MTEYVETPAAAPLGMPVVAIVDADQESRAALESALSRRFGSDYRVVAADSAEAGLEALRSLARQGDAVAIVAADLGLPGTDGVDFLERAHALHPGASRALLLAMDQRGTRIPFGAWRRYNARQR
jgi:thioredoxin reductase (NADPH)